MRIAIRNKPSTPKEVSGIIRDAPKAGAHYETFGPMFNPLAEMLWANFYYVIGDQIEDINSATGSDDDESDWP